MVYETGMLRCLLTVLAQCSNSCALDIADVVQYVMGYFDTLDMPVRYDTT